MRLIFPLTLAILALSACGGDDQQAATGGSEPERQALRAGLVTDVGQLNDRGFNQLAFQGLQRAEKELGVQGRVLESTSDAEYVPNHSSLAEQGYDVVIGVGFAQGEAVAQVAEQYPDTKFVIIDVDQGDLPGTPANVVGLLFFHVSDEADLDRWQSGVYYADDTPKSSLPAVQAASEAARQGELVRSCG